MLGAAPEWQPPLGFTGKGTGASAQPLLEPRLNPVAMCVGFWGDNQNFQTCYKSKAGRLGTFHRQNAILLANGVLRLAQK